MESVAEQIERVQILDPSGSVEELAFREPVEEALAALFPRDLDADNAVAFNYFDDSKFRRIGQLLKQLGQPEWSLRPRTYAVLRMIHRVDDMQAFVLDGLFDISLPYSEKTLPNALNSPSVRSKFMELQSMVLTGPGADLESGAGEHAYFNQDADIPFRRVRILGSGGFGEVDEVWSRLSTKQYARKRIPRGRTFKKDRATVADFERELATLKRLSHLHLVKFIGSYSDPKFVSIIMSPVADCNLADYIRVDPFPEERRSCMRPFYGCLASALLYLHQNKIRHKDIKPSNIIIHGDNVLLTDFGTALDWSDRDRSTTKSMPSALSMPYCSPEVAEWEPRDSSSDIWSLGCVFLEMTSVLRGATLSEMRRFFLSNGNTRLYVRTNEEGSRLWIERLRYLGGLPSDNQPLGWIMDMLRRNAQERPRAAELADRIKAAEGPNSFCGLCCADDGDTDTSEEVLVFGDQTDGFVGLHAERVQPLQVDRVEVAKHICTQPTRLIKDTAESSMGEHPSATTPSHMSITERRKPEPSEPNSTQDELYNTPAEEDAAIELLRERGIDVEDEDFDGSSALPWAIFNGHEAVLRLLVRKGSDIDAMICHGRPALHEAIWLHQENIVRLLLAIGASVNLQDYHGDTALFCAAASGNDAMIRMLVEHGADVEGSVVYGERFLHFAVSTGRTELLQLLIDRGVNLETLSPRGETALLLALRHGHEGPAKLLVEHGVKINVDSGYGTSPLIEAASRCSEDMVRTLIEKGATVNPKSSGRDTPLHRAADRGNEAVVRLLIERGANVAALDLSGQVAVLIATRRDHAEIVRLLLDKAASIGATTCALEKVLEVALNNGAEQVVRLLLEMGVDPHDLEADKVAALLQSTASDGRVAMVQILLDKAVNVNMKLDYDGRTVLHKAVEEQQEDVTRLLIDNGADLNAATKDGQTALHRAIITYQWETVALLLDKGADMKCLSVFEVDFLLRQATEFRRYWMAPLVGENCPPLLSMTDYSCNNGLLPLRELLRAGHHAIAHMLLTRGFKHQPPSTIDCRGALHWAASGGHEWAVQDLIRHRVDREETIEGMTALHEAAKAGHEGVVQQLVNAGARINAKSEKEGRTALHWAAMGGHIQVIRLLVQREKIELQPLTKEGRSPMDEAKLANHEDAELLLRDVIHKAKREELALGIVVILSYVIPLGVIIGVASLFSRQPTKDNEVRYL